MKEAFAKPLGLAALAVATLLAVGGAERSPTGLVLGLPTLAGALAAAVAVATAARLVRDRSGALALMALAIVPGLVILGPHGAAAGALSGPVLSALVLAAIWTLGIPWARSRTYFAPVLLVVYLIGSWGVQREVGPQGDEPHYLMVAESLLRDHDLSLEQDYAEGRYRAFYHGDTLAPHYRVRGRHGEIYSLHAVGLSLLVLPAYALGGYRAASFFMALLAVLAALAIRRLLRAALDDSETADAVAWIVALSPPLVSYAGLIFTEVPAALVVAFALREGLRSRELSAGRAVAVGLAIAVLPWLNVRYAIVAAVLWLFWLWSRPRLAVLATLAGTAAASLIALVAYHFVLYGFFDPRRVYGRQREFSLQTFGWGLPGLLLDQEFGLLVYAPVFALAFPGFVRLLRERRRLGTAAVVLFAAVFATAAAWPMWRGGFNPPARFLVPVVPVLAVAIGSWMKERRAAAVALLVGWGLFVGLAGVRHPGLVHRDRDGTAPLFRAESGALEWTRLLPRYVLFEPDRHRLALVWAAVLAAAVLSARRALRPTSMVTALLVVVAAVEAASRLSLARAGGRESVHLVGRPTLEWPSLRLETRHVSRWTPADLSWGEVYEPYRHSGAVALGERLALRAGSYRLEVSGEPLGGGGGTPPKLRLLGFEARPLAPAECTSSPAGWSCPFAVPFGCREVTLVPDGGSPFRIREIALRFNLPQPGPV